MLVAIHVRQIEVDEKNIASYEYSVMINSKVICRGDFSGHNQTWGWKSLIYALLVDAAKRGDNV